MAGCLECQVRVVVFILVPGASWLGLALAAKGFSGLVTFGARVRARENSETRNLRAGR